MEQIKNITDPAQEMADEHPITKPKTGGIKRSPVNLATSRDSKRLKNDRLVRLMSETSCFKLPAVDNQRLLKSLRRISSDPIKMSTESASIQISKLRLPYEIKQFLDGFLFKFKDPKYANDDSNTTNITSAPVTNTSVTDKDTHVTTSTQTTIKTTDNTTVKSTAIIKSTTAADANDITHATIETNTKVTTTDVSTSNTTTTTTISSAKLTTLASGSDSPSSDKFNDINESSFTEDFNELHSPNSESSEKSKSFIETFHSTNSDGSDKTVVYTKRTSLNELSVSDIEDSLDENGPSNYAFSYEEEELSIVSHKKSPTE